MIPLWTYKHVKATILSDISPYGRGVVGGKRKGPSPWDLRPQDEEATLVANVGGRLVSGHVWPVYQRYGILAAEAAVVPLTGEQANSYFPHRYETIVSDLSRLAPETLDGPLNPHAVLRFARIWGLPEAKPLPLAKTPDSKWAILPHDGMSLFALRELAFTVRACEQLLRAWAEPEVHGAELDYLADHYTLGEMSARELGETHRPLVGYDYDRGMVATTFLPDSRLSSRDAGLAAWLDTICLEETRGMFPLMDTIVRPDGGVGFVRKLAYQTGRQAVFYHVMRMAARLGDLKSCELCGALFVRSHGAQRFCPPPPGLRGAESPCAVKARRQRIGRQPAR